MIDRPILFSAPMVQALLAGRKTQTRRLAWGEIAHRVSGISIRRPSIWQKVKPGDRLWVRETHYVESAGYKDGSGKRILYRATDPDAPAAWTPAIHMYRFASRITLVVTATMIEGLQDITEVDAMREGMQEPTLRNLGGELAQAALSERQVFSRLWRHLHGDDSWAANPDVVALTFTVHRQNIDAMAVAA